MALLSTLAALKSELGITGSGSDTRLSRLLRQASDRIATFCDRNFERRTLAELFTPAPLTIQLSAWPVVGDITVTDNGTVLDEDAYELVIAQGLLSRSSLYGVGYGSPCGYRWWGSITVAYTGGYILPADEDSDLPGDIERACLDLAIRYYHGAGRDPTLRSETVPGVIEQSWSAIDNLPMLGGLPADIADALWAHRRAGL